MHADPKSSILSSSSPRYFATSWHGCSSFSRSYFLIFEGYLKQSLLSSRPGYQGLNLVKELRCLSHPFDPLQGPIAEGNSRLGCFVFRGGDQCTPTASFPHIELKGSRPTLWEPQNLKQNKDHGSSKHTAGPHAPIAQVRSAHVISANWLPG